MADDEQNVDAEQENLQSSELWSLAKPAAVDAEDDDNENKSKKSAAPGAKVGKLIKLLNDVEEQEELDTKVAELDPATGQSLLLWATLQGKFVVVEWLIKKCKRAAFVFQPGNDKELAIYDKWVEIRKEIEEKEREKLLNPPEEEPEGDDEDKAPEPTADQLVLEALSEYHEEWAARGPGLVKSVGELGIYQGARDQQRNKNGLGQTLFPNGDMYCGMYAANHRQGTGTYWWATSGIIYTGLWKDNLRHGIGRIVLPDGGRYLGNWYNDAKNGQGRYTYPDGSSYSGNWVNDVKEGFGTYQFTDGSAFIGSFSEGEFVSGEWRLAGGTRYYGTFKNDVPVGKGVFVYKYGQSNSFRQEGEYTKGSWVAGAISSPSAIPSIEITVQGKGQTLSFSEECGGNSIETLVHIANCGPFLGWVSQVNKLTGTFNVTGGIKVASVSFAEDKSIAQVVIKPSVVDASGKRIRGIDLITLKAPTTRLLVVLCGGEKIVAIVEQVVNACSVVTVQTRLPTVRAALDGSLHGAFVSAVEPALRLTLRKEFTTELAGQMFTTPNKSNASENVLIYIQNIHTDAMATLQKRLPTSPLVKYATVQLSDLASQSTDALTIFAALEAQKRIANQTLPSGTVEAQRPPTPLPPAPEPRPNVEPLLEEEKKLASKKAVVEDE